MTRGCGGLATVRMTEGCGEPGVAGMTGPGWGGGLDAGELLQAVVEAGLGGVDRAFGIQPDAVDAATHELAGLAAGLAPASEAGAVLRPDLDAGPAADVQDAVW